VIWGGEDNVYIVTQQESSGNVYTIFIYDDDDSLSLLLFVRLGDVMIKSDDLFYHFLMVVMHV
jgi:hypothetical protein